MTIIYNYAMSFVGVPYLWGGDTADEGFDCSGLVVEILKASGHIPNKYDATAQQLFRIFDEQLLDEEDDLIFGDLIFFGREWTEIGHVAYALSPLHLLDAGGGNSTTRSKDVANRQGAMVRIRPIAYRNDILGAVRPPAPNYL